MAKAKTKQKKPNIRLNFRSYLRKGMVYCACFLLAMLLLPYALIVLYRFEPIKPISTLMIYEVMTGRFYEREWIELDDISPSLVQSVLMSEDGQYCAHSGVDWAALNLVVESALDGEPSRGASTIAMQSSKNLFLWSSRSYIRKALEIPLALTSDHVWGKRRLLEIYLNIAQWGHGIYGIEAAAQAYFGKGADTLTRRQSALLAVTLPNPILRNPAKPSQGLSRLAGRIETRARQSGAYIKCIYP